MAHPEQSQFFATLARRFEEDFRAARKVVEIGSQDINGSVRQFFSGQSTYLGVDIGSGKAVDWIVPGELLELPNAWADVSISTECFEHCREWEKVFMNMIRITRGEGLLIVTAASIGRAAHGTIDSDLQSSPYTIDYYRNLSLGDIAQKIALGLYFDSHGFELNSSPGDIYFWGRRSSVDVDEASSLWLPPLERLARAQGQLGQAARKNHKLESRLSMLELKHSALQAKHLALKAAIRRVKGLTSESCK